MNSKCAQAVRAGTFTLKNVAEMLPVLSVAGKGIDQKWSALDIFLMDGKL